MAASNYHAHPHVRDLNDYQNRIHNCAQLGAHLLETAGDHSGEEWHLAACQILSRLLLELAGGVPFPPADSLIASPEDRA